MLPLPLINYFPKIFQDQPEAQHLAAVIESFIKTWGSDILNLRRLNRAGETPSYFLPELGYYLNAGLLNTDSEQIKRKKIVNAIRTHKVRGIWFNDAKIRIDNITGFSASIITEPNTSDWILMGGRPSEPASYYWATMGDNNVDTDLGLDLLGTGSELSTPGNVYINCHQGIYGSQLTAEQIAQIVYEIANDVVPAYYIVYLCYTDALGNITIYPNGTIS